MAGAGLALLKSGAIPEQPFSVFEEATMIFQVREWNGGGIGWVARAVDLRNYYKFELLPTSRDHAQPYELTFSLCRSQKRSVPYRYDRLKRPDLALHHNPGWQETATWADVYRADLFERRGWDERGRGGEFDHR